MSETNATKVKSLKESLRVREKELLAVFKELDHYRRKCHKLKLLLIRQKSRDFQNSSVEIRKNLQESPEVLVEKPKFLLGNEGKVEDLKCEEGEIKELEKPKGLPIKRKRRSAVTKFMESISLPLAHTVTEKKEKKPETLKKIEETEESVLSAIEKSLETSTQKPGIKPRATGKPLPTGKAVAYNKPYSMPSAYTEINYSGLLHQPVQYTPLTVSLSQISPQTLKFKEFFEITKKMYSSNYDFNITNLSMIFDLLKTLDPQTATTYFVNEMMQSSYIFSTSDALSIIFGVMKELADQVWDKAFLKSLRMFFIRTLQEIVFVGKEVKLPYLKYNVGTLQEMLLTCFVVVCKQGNYVEIAKKMIVKLLGAKNKEYVKRTFDIWAELANADYSLQVFYKLVVLEIPFEGILQEVSIQVCKIDEKMYKEIYYCFKGAIRYLDVQDAYEAYGKFLWPHLQQAKKDSMAKVLVIEIIGILYLEFEKEGTKKVHFQLKKQLEEILTDKDMASKNYLAFGPKEQRAAAKALKKIGHTGKSGKT